MNGKVQVLSSFWLKIIGFITMTFDHIGTFIGMFYASGSTIGQVGLAFRCIGRLALPIFIFLLVQGLRNSKYPDKYLFRIFIMWAVFFVIGLGVFVASACGASIEVLDSLGGSIPANAFNDLLYVGLFLYLLNHKNKKLRALCAFPLILIGCSYAFDIVNAYGNTSLYMYFPEFIRADYSVFALLLGIGFYYTKPLAAKMADKVFLYETTDKEVAQRRQGLTNMLNACVVVFATAFMYGLSFAYGSYDPLRFSSIGSFAVLSIIFIMLYNGKRGYDSKWFRWVSYLYYPVHIIIIGLIFVLLSL